MFNAECTWFKDTLLLQLTSITVHAHQQSRANPAGQKRLHFSLGTLTAPRH